MADLVLEADIAVAGLPFEAGSARLLAAQPGAIASVMPFRGQSEAVSATVKKKIGAGLAKTGRFADGDEGRVLWAGLGQWLVAGSDAGLAAGLGAALAGKAAVTDQSDGWTQLALIGTGARDVMARLCPLDLSPEAMPEGSAARTEIAHMMAMVTAIPGGFGILVMRSFTGWAVHHIKETMDSVAAQAG